jgi:hypothetical protein
MYVFLGFCDNSVRRLNNTTKKSVTLGTVASNKFWSSMSFQNLVRLSQIEKISLSDYAHVNKVSKNLEKNDN